MTSKLFLSSSLDQITACFIAHMQVNQKLRLLSITVLQSNCNTLIEVNVYTFSYYNYSFFKISFTMKRVSLTSNHEKCFIDTKIHNCQYSEKKLYCLFKKQQIFVSFLYNNLKHVQNFSQKYSNPPSPLTVLTPPF